MEKKKIAGALSPGEQMRLKRSRVLSEKKPAEHYLETVASLNGVDYINDSKSCDLDAAWLSIEKIHKPITWIVGGKSRDNDYSQMQGIVREKVSHVICMGSDVENIFSALHNEAALVVNAADLNEAAFIASRLAKSGEVVLFSPACPSFSAYENYEERGRIFKAAVAKIHWGGL